MHHALLFEAKSIQSFLFDSGRLRDVIGASELVDKLTNSSARNSLLDHTLRALGFREGSLENGHDIDFSRRAGGSFYGFSTKPEVIDNLAALWTLTVQQYAPGLSYDIARGHGDTPLAAFDAAREAMRADASRLRPPLPFTAPIVQRSPRTGQAAVSLDRGDPCDVAVLRKRQAADLSGVGFLDRFAPPDAGLQWRDWPRNLESGDDDSFPYLGQDRTLALIHADGNGLGQLLRRAREAVRVRPDAFIDVFKAISEGIETSTQKAAQAATRQVLLPARANEGLLPARPILLGGDDMTILVRADLALDFLQIFAQQFEAESRAIMADLNAKWKVGFPDHLTVGAGIVYQHASQPFYLATNLVESLTTDVAKRAAKATDAVTPPSSVALYRVTTSLVDDYDDMLERELTHQVIENGDSIGYVDTLGAYALCDTKALPRLADLRDLQRLFQSDDMARGPTRNLLTLLGMSPDQARMAYKRWRQLMRDNRASRLRQFDAIMQRLVQGWQSDAELPYGVLSTSAGRGLRHSPLGDVLALMAVNSLVGPDTSDDQADPMLQERAA
ncbi:MAG: hypothetical protein B7X31_10065 [Thiomonas sp. 13-66-29]|jgi:hypothetical protein|nr:MAG: hypothetical protein B7X31_10065 [Thiomonas sp. 13-66-29]